jgi:acetyl esterase/lipase
VHCTPGELRSTYSVGEPTQVEEPDVTEPLRQVDPGLRRMARLLTRLTPRTSEGYRRQVRLINALPRRPRRPGRTSSRVHGDIEIAQRWTTRRDGSPLRLLLVRPAVPRDGAPGVLWIHGGGYAIGTPEQSRATAQRLVAATNCVIVLPDYRLSTEVPLYPMIDDRPTPSSRDNHTPVWNSATNNAAWDLYLGSLRGGDVPAYAAPARATDLARLPPTLTFVGDIEPFHAEVVDYAERLRAAGVPVTSRVYPGALHGFDLVVRSAPISQARAFFLDGFREFTATYRASQPVRR